LWWRVAVAVVATQTPMLLAAAAAQVDSAQELV